TAGVADDLRPAAGHAGIQLIEERLDDSGPLQVGQVLGIHGGEELAGIGQDARGEGRGILDGDTGGAPSTAVMSPVLTTCTLSAAVPPSNLLFGSVTSRVMDTLDAAPRSGIPREQA